MLASKQFQNCRDVTGFQSLVALVEDMMTEPSNDRNRPAPPSSWTERVLPLRRMDYCAIAQNGVAFLRFHRPAIASHPQREMSRRR
jgi:hypothetical protein